MNRFTKKFKNVNFGQNKDFSEKSKNNQFNEIFFLVIW